MDINELIDLHFDVNWDIYDDQLFDDFPNGHPSQPLADALDFLMAWVVDASYAPGRFVQPRPVSINEPF